MVVSWRFSRKSIQWYSNSFVHGLVCRTFLQEALVSLQTMKVSSCQHFHPILGLIAFRKIFAQQKNTVNWMGSNKIAKSSRKIGNVQYIMLWTEWSLFRMLSNSFQEYLAFMFASDSMAATEVRLIFLEMGTWANSALANGPFKYCGVYVRCIRV